MVYYININIPNKIELGKKPVLAYSTSTLGYRRLILDQGKTYSDNGHTFMLGSGSSDGMPGQDADGPEITLDAFPELYSILSEGIDRIKAGETRRLP
jgi:hypothetical protein